MNLRRQYRTARANPWFAVAYLFSLAFGLVVAIGRAPLPGLVAWPHPGGYALGSRLAAGETAVVLGRVRGFAGVLFVLLVFVTVIKEVTEGVMEGHTDALVLAGGVKSVAVGGVVTTLLVTGSQFGPIVLAGAVAFGIGASSVAATLGLLVAGAALLAAAVPTGFALATAARLVFLRVSLLREHRTLAGAPLAVTYFALFVRARDSMALLAGLPPGGFADVGLAAVGVASPGGVFPALGVVALGTVGGTTLSIPLTGRLLIGDSAPRGADEPAAANAPERARPLDRVVSRPVAAVTRSVWVRVRREPRSLVFAAMSAGVAATVGLEVVTQIPAALPAVVAVYGGATTGMGATLNPLGAAGVGLPAALTAPRGGRALVRGYALSAALPGVPVVASATLLAALAAGQPPLVVAAVTATGALFAVVAAVISLAVGLAVPNLDGLRPAGSGLRPPKLWATTLFLAIMAGIGVPALVGVGVGGGAGVRAGATPAPTVTTALLGIVTSGVLAVLAGVVAYRRALRLTVDYQIE